MTSTFEVEFDAFALRSPRGESYHTIPAENCRVGLVSRRRLGSGPDGRDVELPPEFEAAFIRNGGAWLPAVFTLRQVAPLLLQDECSR